MHPPRVDVSQARQSARERPRAQRSGNTGRVLCCRKAGQACAEFAKMPGLGGSFLRRPGWEEFRRVLGSLRALCPAANPVVVRTAWMAENILGECVRRRARFVIRLNNQLRQDQAVEVLCHEWAHALAWNYSLDRLSKTPGIDPAAFDHASHDEAWGCAYSRVWRVYITSS
jgi:hypothetical protein